MDMPAEILSKIFVSGTNPIGFDSSRAPLLLTKVCQLWRTVSLAVQYLWTVLPRLGIRRDNGYVTALLSPHLHRAGKLGITFANNMDEPSRDSLSRLFADHRGKMLPSEDVCLGPRKPNLPWPQIEYYNGDVLDIVNGDVSDILLQCTQLETLDLTSRRTDRVKHSGMQASIFLPRLRKLYLMDEKGTLDQFLNSLRAPLLEVIQISNTYFNLPVPDALIACTIRSHCTGLTSLKLLCFRIEADELLQLSRITLGLRELDVFPTPDALRALMFSPTRNNIFPRLARLTIRGVQMDDQELIDICRSRFSNLSDVERGFQWESLQYCKVYIGDQRGARRLQDVAESFQDSARFQDVLSELRLSSLSRGMSEISSKDLLNLEDCLGFLETYEISHPLLLERHCFVDIMSDFSRGNTATPSYMRVRASALLAKWGPLAKEYGARDARWLLRGRADSWQLVYRPDIKDCFMSKFTTTD
ncbi:hypothetical protein BD779DRAFT_1542160 [Infundibulicybe gibba]|nr:hypothetical protein BD779DRAFT_1542160 [Infundibulicybe gibba]